MVPAAALVVVAAGEEHADTFLGANTAARRRTARDSRRDFRRKWRNALSPTVERRCQIPRFVDCDHFDTWCSHDRRRFDAANCRAEAIADRGLG